MSGRGSSSAFGARLRQWRARRAISQFDLAMRAGTTSRHVSFLETGRSRPGVELVLRIASALDVPLEARNELLVLAGLPPQFPVRALDDDAMRPVASVLDRLLTSHEPYPAWVFERALRPLRANTAAERLFPGLTEMSPEAIVDLWFGPGPFREVVTNWQEVVLAGVDALERDAAHASDPELEALARRARAHAGSRDLASKAPGSFPVVCPHFAFGGRSVRTISAVMRFDTAVEITASRLRVELMFPADDPSAAFFRDIASAR